MRKRRSANAFLSADALAEELRQLEADIENLRQNLYHVASAKGLADEDVFTISRGLDMLIVRHSRLKRFLDRLSLQARWSAYPISRRGRRPRASKRLTKRR